MRQFILTVLLSSMTLLATAASAAKPEPTPTPTPAPSMTMITLSGKITDNGSDSLAGAAIEIAGQKVYADFDGNFTLTVPSDSELEANVSLISYKSQQIKLSTSKNQSISIVLEQ